MRVKVSPLRRQGCATAQQAGCGGKGSDNWTVTLNTLTATAAHLEIKQDGSTVFCRNYTLGGAAIGTAC